MKTVFRALAFVAAALLASASSAEAAVSYSFTGVSNNNVTNTSIGEANLSMLVTDSGGGYVRFDFYNSSTDGSAITDVYFDDSVDPALFVTPISQIINGSGVSFAEGATPGNLPSGGTFDATKGLTADSDAPVYGNGVGYGETLGIVLQLDNGNSYGDVVTALSDSSLRVGLHVQGFGNGGSESFVNNPGGGTPPAVPEPSTLAIFGLGALFAGRRMRRRNA